MIDVQQSLGPWIPQVTGRYINEDWNPDNQGFGAQCWDLAANWSKYLSLPVISTGGPGRWPGWAGNMVDAFPQSDAIAAAYELVGPDGAGQPGDIAVWGDGYYYYPKTHVAVLVKDAGGLLLCASQNSSASLPGNPYPAWSTGPTILQHLPRRGLIGFIRARTSTITLQGSAPASEEGFLMALTDSEQNELLLNVRKLVGAGVEQDAYLSGVNGKVDEIVGNARKTFWNTEESRIILAETPATQIAASIDAAGLAVSVRNELVKLLGGN